MTMTKMRKEYERPVLVEIGSLVEITENGTPIFQGPPGDRSGGRANCNANINANPGLCS